MLCEMSVGSRYSSAVVVSLLGLASLHLSFVLLHGVDHADGLLPLANLRLLG